ncbi:MAG: dephospho-CoA kinase [Pseudomonadota bacterium]
MSIFTIGLTGGLASGKSTVLEFFRKLGIDTFSADNVVHQLMANDGLAYSSIVNHFSKTILDAENKINRAKLREIIFNTPEEKRWLENYLHPLVRATLLEQRDKSKSPYVVIEIPLLAESKTPFEWINRILVIDADEKIQQLRAQQRSGLSEAESRHILNQQASRQIRNRIADDMIVNHGDLFELEHQVNTLHYKYLKLS